MTKVIDQDRCTRCGDCLPVCPNEGITIHVGEYTIESGLCTRCYGFSAAPQCERVCPADAVIDSPAPLGEPEMARRAAFLRPERFPRD
jgi:ferredoxin